MDELRIGRMLDRYGIPFFHKQATIIYTEGRKELWNPSFTLYSYGGTAIDYVASSSPSITPSDRDVHYSPRRPFPAERNVQPVRCPDR